MTPAPLYTTRKVQLDQDLPAVSREHFLNELSMYRGVPYEEGGTSIEGIDCSGLVQAVFGALGVRTPRTVIEQWETGTPVSRDGIRTADLVFFGRDYGPDHVGIAVSGDEVVHASPSRGVVVENIDSLDGAKQFQGARRLVRLQ
jgi:lipoprotein Spr